MNIEDNNSKIHIVCEQVLFCFVLNYCLECHLLFLVFERTLVSPFVPPAVAPFPASHHLPLFLPRRNI